MLEFNIRNQSISRIDNFSPAEKSKGYLVAKFNFITEEWEEAEKTAVFQSAKGLEPIDMVLSYDNKCIVPWEVIDSSGKVFVSVYGVIDGKRITTDKSEFKVNPTIYGGSATREPTPTVYEQLLDKLNNVDGGTFEDWNKSEV